LEILSALSRWIHVLAGIVWIGMLYFFNFVNIPFQGTQDGDTKKKVNPELLPRALFWFRWGAAWTWVTGVILLQLVFWGGHITVDPMRGWSPLAIAMLALVFVAPFIYDPLAKSIKNPKLFGAVAFFLLFVVIGLMQYSGYTYRAYNIHLASLLGTIMAWNVWFRIWPAQQKIVRAVKEGAAPDADLVKLAGLRSRHNTYLSVPLLYTMLAQHTTFFSGGNWGIGNDTWWIVFLAVIGLGWHVVFHLYKRSAKVQGF
jgi:uncharacterized membrane protein